MSRGGRKGKAADNDRMVAGIGPVSELLKAAPSTIRRICVSRSRADKMAKGDGRRDPVEAIVRSADYHGIDVERVDIGELDRMVGRDQRHQGVVAHTREFEYSDLDDVVSVIEGPALLVALDGVTDPHNLGAVVRSAYLLGANAVIVPRDRAAGVTPAAAKTSAGAVEHLPIVQVTNLARALSDLKEHGIWNCAIAAGAAAAPIQTLDATMPLCLVLGSEGSGIRPQVAKQCDFHVEIPMHRSGVGSFNVSVAAAIALYEIARARQS